MNIFKKIWDKRSVFRSLLYSIYFNFYYLPIKQAWRLPILLYKPDLLKMKGKVILDVEKVKTGMIQIGFRKVSLYPNHGFIYENKGGIITFKGRCSIGNLSAFSIGKDGNLEFGNNFIATAGLKLTSYCSVKFGQNVLVAWDVLIMDTSLHKLKTLEGGTTGKSMVPISIGNDNWITARCMVLQGTKTPDYCIFGAGSLLNKDYTNYPTHVLLAGSPLKVKATNIWRDINDDGVI
jgi:acetyltransferase-like isoleucine patch superfamily enzyme